MKRFLTRRNIIILLVVLAGVVLFATRPKGNAAVVKTAKVERKDLVNSLTVSGKVEAEKRATLNFLSPGKLAFVRVKSGQPVQAGEWLAGLDLGDLQAAERAAYYSYLSADANAKQVEDAVKGHEGDESFAQKNQRVAAQTLRDKAYDAWLSSQRAVQNATLKTPFSGVVTDVTMSSAGDIVGATDGVTVVDPETISFRTEVNENDIAQVRVGQTAVVRLDAFPNKTFMGTVKRMAFATTVGDTGATVLPLWIDLPAYVLPNLKLGLNGDAEIELETAKSVLVLPSEAVRDGKVTLPGGKEQAVETGLESDTEIEVKSGLNEGDVVIVK